MKIILTGNPLSTNHIYKKSKFGMYMSAEGHALKESYQWEATSQWKDKMLLGRVIVCIKLFFGDLRNRDIDNYNKILLDSLTGIVWKDDKQIVKMEIEKLYDKKNPRVEIEIL
jgi:crossover junction endodeoxyribonuclease RusA